MEEFELFETIKQEIVQNQKLSNNKCGTTIVYLMQKFNLNSEEVKKIIR